MESASDTGQDTDTKGSSWYTRRYERAFQIKPPPLELQMEEGSGPKKRMDDGRCKMLPFRRNTCLRMLKNFICQQSSSSTTNIVSVT